MAATTGTPSGGTSGTSNGKPQVTKVANSSHDKPDAASAATTESNQPSAEKILETSPGSTTGSTSTGTDTPTPSSITVTQSDTGKISAATYSGPTGIGGVTEPSMASPTAVEQFSRPDSGTTSTATIDTSSRTNTGPEADSGTTDNMTETARDTGQQVSSRAAEEWQQRKQQVSEVAGNLKDSATHSAEQVRDGASRATYRVRQQSRQGVNAAQTMITDHPIATALVALGIGLLLGSMWGGQGRKSPAYGYRDRESDYRRAEANAGYDRSGY
jgi:ElaB/YqjD/DUF883 family membrane-anchored ribosome-binding protein